jgi:hypothetical protein
MESTPASSHLESPAQPGDLSILVYRPHLCKFISRNDQPFELYSSSSGCMIQICECDLELLVSPSILLFTCSVYSRPLGGPLQCMGGIIFDFTPREYSLSAISPFEFLHGCDWCLCLDIICMAGHSIATDVSRLHTAGSHGDASMCLEGRGVGWGPFRKW